MTDKKPNDLENLKDLPGFKRSNPIYFENEVIDHLISITLELGAELWVVKDRLAHFEEVLSERDSLVKRLEMLPIECVVRNIAAGSICKRLGIEEGIDLDPPTFEFFYKDDALHDPMINDYHIISFGWASRQQIVQMKERTFEVNNILKELFSTAGMILVDYKLEFGVYKGELLLGDEFTPDGCRVWDSETREKLDKDRFRQDLGEVVESYKIIAKKLGIN